MPQLPILKTQRLILRPFRMTDAPDVQRLAGERAIADTTLNIPHPYEDGMAEQWIATHQPKYVAGELANYAITLHSTKELIGVVGLVIDTRAGRAELGYWIGVPYWGCGYCTEAGQAILTFGFTELKLNRIYATYFTRNPASGRVMQKLGMTYEGTLRQHVKKWGNYEDLVIYGILNEEWRKRT